MKKTYNIFLGIMVVTILNSATLGLLTFAFMFGGGRLDTGAALYYLPNTIIAIFIVIFSLLEKKRGSGGILWLPMVLSYFVLLIEFTIAASLFSTFLDNAIVITMYFILPIFCLYLLIRKYYVYYKSNVSGMKVSTVQTSKFSYALLTIIILALIAAVAYSFKGPKTTSYELNNLKTESNRDLPVNDKSVVYQKYTDSKYHFEVKYPDHWITNGGQVSDLGGFYYVNFGTSSLDIARTPLAQIKIYPDINSIEEFSKQFSYLKGKWRDAKVDGIYAKQIDISSQDDRGFYAKQIDKTNEVSKEFTVTITIFAKDGFGYEINSTAFGQYSVLVKDMTTSFKFK